MKLLFLLLILGSSSALANRILPLAERAMKANLTKQARIKIKNILHGKIAFDSAKLNQFTQDNLVLDIINNDINIAMALLPKSLTHGEELNFDDIAVSYGSQSIKPEGLHDYLVGYFGEEHALTDADIVLLARYSPRYLAIHDATVSEGAIKLGSSTYYDIGAPAGKKEIGLVDILVEEITELPKDSEDKLAKVAFERLFTYHTQGKSDEEIAGLIAGIQRTFFPQKMQASGADAKDGNGSSVEPQNETTSALQDFATTGKEFGIPPYEEVAKTVSPALGTTQEQAEIQTPAAKPSVEEEPSTTFAEFLKQKVTEQKSRDSEFTGKALAKKLDLYESAINEFSRGRKHPAYESITKMLDGGIATELRLNDAELDKFIDLWRRETEHKLTDDEQSYLNDLINRNKSDNTQETEVRTTEEAQETEPSVEEEPNTTFAEFLGQKVEDSGWSKSDLSKGIYDGAINKFISSYDGKTRLPSYDIMVRMLKSNLATKLNLNDGELSTFINLWKHETKETLTDEQQSYLDGFVNRNKSGDMQAAEVQETGDEPQEAKDKFVSFFKDRVDAMGIKNLSQLSKKVMGKTTTHFYGLVKNKAIPQYDTMETMLNGGLATALGLNAAELDEFIDLWKEAHKQSNSTKAKRVTEEEVDRLKEIGRQEIEQQEVHIRAADRQVDAVQETETQVKEIQEVQEAKTTESTPDTMSADDDILAKLNAELKNTTNPSDRAEIEQDISDVETAHLLAKEAEKNALKRLEQREEAKKAYRKAEAKLTAAMQSEEGVKWEDIKTYAENKETSIARMTAKIEELRQLLKEDQDPVASWERMAGLTENQLGQYLEGNSVLTKDDYHALCVLKGMCVGDEVESMLAVERVLALHQQNIDELKIKDYVSDKNNQTTLDKAYDLWLQAKEKAQQ